MDSQDAEQWRAIRAVWGDAFYALVSGKGRETTAGDACRGAWKAIHRLVEEEEGTFDPEHAVLVRAAIVAWQDRNASLLPMPFQEVDKLADATTAHVDTMRTSLPDFGWSDV